MLGVDAGTSSIKVAVYDMKAFNRKRPLKYSLIEQSGYSEQNPADWIEGFERALLSF